MKYSKINAFFISNVKLAAIALLLFSVSTSASAQTEEIILPEGVEIFIQNTVENDDSITFDLIIENNTDTDIKEAFLVAEYSSLELVVESIHEELFPELYSIRSRDVYQGELTLEFPTFLNQEAILEISLVDEFGELMYKQDVGMVDAEGPGEQIVLFQDSCYIQLNQMSTSSILVSDYLLYDSAQTYQYKCEVVNNTDSIQEVVPQVITTRQDRFPTLLKSVNNSINLEPGVNSVSFDFETLSYSGNFTNHLSLLHESIDVPKVSLDYYVEESVGSFNKVTTNSGPFVAQDTFVAQADISLAPTGAATSSIIELTVIMLDESGQECFPMIRQEVTSEATTVSEELIKDCPYYDLSINLINQDGLVLDQYTDSIKPPDTPPEEVVSAESDDEADYVFYMILTVIVLVIVLTAFIVLFREKTPKEKTINNTTNDNSYEIK